MAGLLRLILLSIAVVSLAAPAPSCCAALYRVLMKGTQVTDAEWAATTGWLEAESAEWSCRTVAIRD